MAKKCLACGKNIGMLTVRIPLLEDSDEVICDECFEKMPTQIKELYKGTLRLDHQELLDMKNYIVSETKNKGFEDKVIDYVSAYMDKKIHSLKPSQEQIIKRIVENESLLEEARKKMLFTNSFNFEGYKITEYIKLVSGEVVLGSGFLSELSAQVNDFLGSNSTEFERKLSKAKMVAQNKMIADAETVGANAIIAIDFDIMTLAGNIIVVSANGTAVKIEKM